MKNIGVIDISRYQTAVKEHGEHHIEGEDAPARQVLLRKAVGQSDGQKDTAESADGRQYKGNAIGS